MLLLLALPCIPPVAAEEFPAGGFLDTDGQVHAPLATGKITTLIFISPDCPISNAYAPELNRIVAEYSAKGGAFFLVHADPQVSAETARKHAAEYGYRCPVLLDPRQTLVHRTGVTVTPEAAVFATDGALLYRGRIDDWYADLGKRRATPRTRDLRDALDAALAGKPVPTATTAAIGCFIPK